MTSHSRRLRAKIALLAPELRAAARSFWDHPDLAEIFPVYLCAVHGSIRATVPLLEAAAEAARRRAPSDPVAAALVDYYAMHAGEEVEHDEWLLDDIAALGLDREDVLRRQPSTSVASLVGAQYYWALHVHPVSLMGFLAVLERPADPDDWHRVRARTGLPEAAFRTVLHHAVLDADHQQDLDEALDALPLDDRLARVVGVSALHTVARQTEIFRELASTPERFAVAEIAGARVVDPR